MNRTPRPARQPGRLAKTVAILLALAATLAPASPAHAATTTDTIQSDYLRITSTADWTAMGALNPDRDETWLVTVAATPPDPGKISVALQATGALALAVSATVCTSEWQPNGCPGTAFPLLQDSLAPTAATIILDEQPSQETIYLRLNVRAAAETTPGTTAALTVTVAGEGFDTTVVPGKPLAPALPSTGSQLEFWPIAAAALAIVLGCAHLVAAARKEKRQ